jgi:hypothetical protein
LPDWDAVIEHVPAAVKVTVGPATVQVPAALNATDKPELAAAETVNGGWPRMRSGRIPNVMVWSAFGVNTRNVVDKMAFS